MHPILYRLLAPTALSLSSLLLSRVAGAESVYLYGPEYVATLAGVAAPARDLGTTGRGATASVIFGHQFSSHLLVEFNLQSSIFETGVNRGTDFYQNGGTLDLTYQLLDRRQARLTPFAFIGGGAMYDDFYPNSRDKVRPVVEAGVGVVTQPLFRGGIRFRLDARYVHEFNDSGYAEPRAVFGVEVPLGRVERHAEVLAPIEVHEVVREVIREVPVPTRALRDTDGDGVDDDHDQCPDTPHGMRVDAQGCALANQTVTLAGVNFDFNRANLTPGAMTVLDRVSLAFVGQPSLRAEIAGHTDTVGSSEANMVLSQSRAQAVRDYLLTRGARAGQLVARGYGKSQLLVSDEKSDADGERNRRVELRVLAR